LRNAIEIAQAVEMDASARRPYLARLRNALEIAHAAEMLPAIHSDPADRFILATAQILKARVLSPDTIMPQYPGIIVQW